jgi:hypothetical protein
MKQTVEEKPPVSIASGLGSATILSWKPREILIRTDAPRATSIILRQFYYPKWIAFDASSKSFLKVEPIAPEGLTRVTIPAGEHEIRVSLPRDLAERLGSYASWGSIMALIAMAWNSTRRGRGQAKTCRASAELLDQSIFPDSDEEIDR